jgi:hypothetical protein
MPKRRFPNLWRGSALALILVLGACTQGGQFDPTELLSGDALSGKKRLQGEREPLFPQGVPGAETGVPPDLVKGYQPPPEQAAAAEGSVVATKPAAAAKKPKSASKPTVANAPAVAPQTNQSAQSPWPPGQAAPAPAQANWPAPPPAQANWPPPPPPIGQPAQGTAAQTNWPAPPPTGQLAPGTAAQTQ